MELTDASCERARRSRDARFDGRFFVAVRTTGVFCRPTCPVQPPNAANVRFYGTAAAASAAGYRPCLRCLPELAPGVRASDGSPPLVTQALALIERGFLDDADSAALAAAVGVTDRHLRRLFACHIGATPQRVAHTRRLLFAKHLLDQSALSVTDIAFAAGFGSVRRFNSLIKSTWGRSPRALRRYRAAADEGIRLRLDYRPPLDWPALLDFYRHRAIPEVESVGETTYRRSVRVGDGSGWFAVRPAPDGHALELEAHLSDMGHLLRLVRGVRRMFDLDADPLAVAAALGDDPLLGPVIERQPGLRVPGAWDPFEVAVRAILGQQISVAAARTLAARLVAHYGGSLGDGTAAGPTRTFPAPATLAEAPLETQGVIGTRAAAIRELSARTACGELDFEAPDLAARLLAIPGIGDWIAQYVCLRSGLDPDAFPAADLGLLRGAGEGRDMTPAKLRRRAEAWRPWRAYAAICLWRRHAESMAR
ncbi:AlkA N-terminal domain-containing protein [Salinisphaera sp. PC39]|uniref:AlkA N-terminal domain-containing protein n=1 Tax=Salinisphaera sp. PC39 TaxID=1304156 RepID=UPI0033420A96